MSAEDVEDGEVATATNEKYCSDNGDSGARDARVEFGLFRPSVRDFAVEETGR